MDLNQNPYYDDHEEQFDKKYKQLLFNPGRPLQARELTQTQSLLIDQIKSNMGTIYKNGSLVEGCDLSISSEQTYNRSDIEIDSNNDTLISTTTDLSVFSIGDQLTLNGSTSNDGVYTVVASSLNSLEVTPSFVSDEAAGFEVELKKDELTAYISNGLIFYDGRVFAVDAQELSITKSGVEKFGLQLSESIVYAYNDSSLNDPAQGYDNYNLSGADRLKQDWVFVTGDSTFFETEDTFEFYEVNDGVLVEAAEKPEYNKILDTLAERTFDESGNYLVEGMELYVRDNEDSTKIDYYLSDGTAYVKGYKVNFIAPQFETVDISDTTAQRLNELHLYQNGTNVYDINVPFFTQMDSMEVEVEVTMNILRSSVNPYDFFLDNDTSDTYNSVNSIVSIGGYTQGVDYALDIQDGNSIINWDQGGSAPISGNPYSVTFRYTRIFVEDTDYSISTKVDDTDYKEITFLYPGGYTIVDGGDIELDYTYYLARTDLVSLDMDGNIIITQGEPVYFTQDLVPESSEQNLQIGTIKLFPNLGEDRSLIYEYKFNRITMRDLYKLLTRVDDLELNQAELALEAEAKDSELPTELRGIFVDNFNGFDKIATESTNPPFKAAVNAIDNELTMQIEYEDIVFDPSNHTYSNTSLDTGDDPFVASLSRTSENVALAIQTKTDTMNLNPYGFIPTAGKAHSSPVTDYWVDTQIKNITSTKNVNTSTTTNTSWKWLWWWSSRRSSTSSSKRFLGSSISNSESIQNKLITNARQITIKVSGKKWMNGSLILVKFDGKAVNATATGTTTSFNKNGNNHLVVESDGSFTGTIVVPTGTKTGAHKISFIDIDNELVTTSVFNSRGIQKIITRRQTITNRFQTVNTLTRSRRSWRWDRDGRCFGDADPLAQSFQFDVDKTFSSIDLYFKSKGASTSAFLQIGFIENGYPSSDTIFHHQDIADTDVTTSVDGSIATNLEFTKPIFIPAQKKFFITVGSESNEYAIFVSEMGQKDIETDRTVLTNPYLTGNLFASSNNDTWTALQTKDMSFKLYEGVFNTYGEITTENVTGLNVGTAILQTENTTPNNGEILYQLSTNNGTSWVTVLPEEVNNLDALATQAQVKIILKGDGANTPLVDIESISCMGARYNTEDDNYYVTRTVENVPVFNTIKTIFDYHEPSGSSIKLYGQIEPGLKFPLDGSAPTQTFVDFDMNELLYSTDITQFSTIDITGAASGTPIEGELFDDGSGNSFIFHDENTNKAIISTITGTISINTVFTANGGSGASITTDSTLNQTAYTTADEFTGFINLKNSTALNSPVIEKLKYIMKEI